MCKCLWFLLNGIYSTLTKTKRENRDRDYIKSHKGRLSAQATQLADHGQSFGETGLN